MDVECFPPLPDARDALLELRRLNLAMLDVWRRRKDDFMRNYVMLGRWGENPSHPVLSEWRMRLTHSPLCGQPDERLPDPKDIFVVAPGVQPYLPPNELWHCTERLRHLREDAINLNFNPRRLALDVQAAVYELFKLPEMLEDHLLATIAATQLSSANGQPTGDSPNLPQVNLDTNQVRYDGKCHDVSADGALLYRQLVESYPHAFSASRLFTKPSRVKDCLPDALKGLIVAETGKGYRLNLS